MRSDDPRRIGMSFNTKAGEYMAELERKNDDLEDIMSRHIQQKLRIAELEAELEAQKNTRVEWQQRAWIAEAGLTNLKTLARAVVDAELLPPEGDYYYSESDQEIMAALAAAVEEKKE